MVSKPSNDISAKMLQIFHIKSGPDRQAGDVEHVPLMIPQWGHMAGTKIGNGKMFSHNKDVFVQMKWQPNKTQLVLVSKSVTSVNIGFSPA